jgi:drug/metabolite transporter (DMT)-like permease
MLKYVLLITSMTLAITGQLSFKHGLNGLVLSPNVQTVLKAIFTPYVFVGFMCYGISSIIWLFVLERFPLSVAYPALALSYVIIVFASFIFLKEPLTVNKVIGSWIILTGVFVLFR